MLCLLFLFLKVRAVTHWKVLVWWKISEFINYIWHLEQQTCTAVYPNQTTWCHSHMFVHLTDIWLRLLALCITQLFWFIWFEVNCWTDHGRLGNLSQSRIYSQVRGLNRDRELLFLRKKKCKCGEKYPASTECFTAGELVNSPTSLLVYSQTFLVQTGAYGHLSKRKI